LLAPLRNHKEDYTGKDSNCSLLILVISDTRRVRYFVCGMPGSQGDSLEFRSRSWHAAMYMEDLNARPLSPRKFILGDAGFALTRFLVRGGRETWTGRHRREGHLVDGGVGGVGTLVLAVVASVWASVGNTYLKTAVGLFDKCNVMFFGSFFFILISWAWTSASWLDAHITPFREVDIHGPNMTSMRRFSHYHAKLRVVVENTFCRLNGRWRVLKMIYAHPDLAACIQNFCVALHQSLETWDLAYEEEQLVVSEDTTVADVDERASDQTAHDAGCVRRIEIVKAL